MSTTVKVVPLKDESPGGGEQRRPVDLYCSHFEAERWVVSVRDPRVQHADLVFIQVVRVVDHKQEV